MHTEQQTERGSEVGEPTPEPVSSVFAIALSNPVHVPGSGGEAGGEVGGEGEGQAAAPVPHTKCPTMPSASPGSLQNNFLPKSRDAHPAWVSASTLASPHVSRTHDPAEMPSRVQPLP